MARKGKRMGRPAMNMNKGAGHGRASKIGHTRGNHKQKTHGKGSRI